MGSKDVFAHLGSTIAGVMFVWAIFQQYFPYELRKHIEKYSQRLVGYVYPYIQITFNEFTGERLMRSEAYSAIENYLSSKSATQAKRLKADIKHNESLVLSMDDHEEVSDEFKGVKVLWASGKNISKQQTFSYAPINDEKRYYKLNFHKRERDLIIGPYLAHVLKEGKAIRVRNRQRKLYTNNGSHWSHVVFEHPATFKTLLYGPPGTGKSTMIAAMANLLGYDLYDLELTAVKDNTELRRLLIETTSKSIIVIEDIDCSLDLTGQRRKRKEKGEDDNLTDPREKLEKEERETKPSQVTLSGLLNFIDGLWSACRGERLIVFTTNYVEKLDAALIRKGRMDKHIELSYCNFESFLVLSRNYLKLESHRLFPRIKELLGEVDMTPADVAEHLMPKRIYGDAEICLNNLIQALEKEIENARVKAEEEKGKEKEALGGEEEENKEIIM